MFEGWVCLHRSIMDWEWYQNSTVKSVFIHCLLKANHKGKSWQGMNIERGSFFTSYEHLATETGLTVDQIRHSISLLVKSGAIRKERKNRGVLLFCVNYDFYQSQSNANQFPCASQTDANRFPITNNDNNNNNVNNANKSRRRRNKVKLKSEPSYDLEEIKRRSMYDDDYDI